MTFKRISLGKTGENLAQQFLKKKGYSILHTNYRTRLGEIDIIAKHKNCLIFIEVKTRKTTTHGSPFSSITWNKQRQISRVALEYLSKTDNYNRDARFDVIAVVVKDLETPAINHLENAFELNY